MGLSRAEAPYVSVPLNCVLQLMPSAFSCEEKVSHFPSMLIYLFVLVFLCLFSLYIHLFIFTLNLFVTSFMLLTLTMPLLCILYAFLFYIVCSGMYCTCPRKPLPLTDRMRQPAVNMH